MSCLKTDEQRCSSLVQGSHWWLKKMLKTTKWKVKHQVCFMHEVVTSSAFAMIYTNFREVSQPPKCLDESTRNKHFIAFIEYFSRICTNLKRHKLVYLLLSKHTYRPMRVRRLVSQLFQKCQCLHFFILQNRHNCFAYLTN